ncbi:MAG: hypothetical protein NVS2B7_37560 [Herpetosiphon sp.]
MGGSHIRPSQATMVDLISTVQALSRQEKWWRPGDRVVVALSGGPDSLCLAHLLQRVAHHEGWSIHLAHLDHDLRPDSGADAAFVRTIAAAWGVPITVALRDVAAHARATGRGIEAAARELRYDFLRAVAVAVGAQTIATGHTVDDQAETVLLRLLRGAGPTGLGAMRLSAPLHGLTLARPLLPITRAQTVAYCAAYKLEPRDDPSNRSPLFTRNRVRHELLPRLKDFNPRIVPALSRTATICADEDDYLNARLDELWGGLATVQLNEVVLARPALLLLHRALQRRALRRAAGLLGPLNNLGADHLARMLAVATRGNGRLQLPDGRWLAARSKIIILCKGDR